MLLRVKRLILRLSYAFMLVLLQSGVAAAGQKTSNPAQAPALTPVKHLIVIVGENRSFDHIFGLYRPRREQTIWNLLSRRIVNADGTPGPNFARAAQFQVPPQSSYYISAPARIKYASLPPPVVDGAPRARSESRPPFPAIRMAAAAEPALGQSEQRLLTTGATGLDKDQRIDTRVKGYDALPDGPFQLTGPRLPYDSYTGDTVHRFFQMWQQSDCSPPDDTNRVGCLGDLYPFVAVGYSAAGYGGGNSMGFYNVNSGDAPLLKKLADEFASSDNFHQSFMGGTGANHMMLGTGDAIFFTDGKGNPAVPPPELIANPDPQTGSRNRYIRNGRWVECGDGSAPGVRPIVDYLRKMGLPSKCEGGRYYMINNTPPAFLANGTLRSGSPGSFVPPSNLRTIGDALSEKGISWVYYGGAFNAARRLDRLGQAYCQICNPFQYVSSFMTNPAQRAEHLKDVADLFSALAGDTLPAVSFVKPDAMVDGHPGSSKLGLFEAFVSNILDLLEGNPSLKHDTAVFITFDESGGYYDSGYIQPLDFFGDGPRIPFIAVSDYSKGGRVVHTYYDHVSILKFIERNWGLKPLTARSRDHLPNPVARPDSPYIPRNRPAIGDLFEMFEFPETGRRKRAP